MKWGSLLVLLLITVGALAQEKVYVTGNGQAYSKKQWDSLWYASGDWVEFVRHQRSHDTVEVTLVHVDRWDFISDICRDGRCDAIVYANQPDAWDESFFSRVAAVKVTSFKLSPTARSRMERSIPKTNNVVNLNRMFEVKILESELRALLFKVLHYYHLDTMESSPASCYEPRNAIVFMDRQETVIGYVELCFGCRRAQSEPNMLGIEETFFDEQWEAIRRIFMVAGIKYGTDLSERN